MMQHQIHEREKEGRVLLFKQNKQAKEEDTQETPHREKMVKDSGNVRVRWVKQAKSVLLVVCFMPPLCPIIQR